MWPDDLANETPLPPEDPIATTVTGLMRASRHAAALALARRTPGVINKPGPGGATPLMSAVLYGSAGDVAALLRAGADPNLRNHAGATALTWAITDTAKVKLLLDAGAEVNAASDFGRAPLMLAAAIGSAPTVAILLERKAEATPAALTAAASRGNVEMVRMLLAAGARDTSGNAMLGALRVNSRETLEALASMKPDKSTAPTLFAVLPPAAGANPEAIRAALDLGANANVRDAKSRTPLMLAAIAETLPADAIRLLIERGADPTATDPHGRSALDFARLLGATPIVEALTDAGVPSNFASTQLPEFVKNNSVRAAVSRSLPLLQRTALSFYEKSGCVSCHNNSLTAMTVSTARRYGFAVDEPKARKELDTIAEDIRITREQALQGIVSPGGLTTTSGYILMGLAAERYAADPATDALVRLIVARQMPDGKWLSAYRPPSESSEFTATAVSLRGIQLYGSGRPAERRAIAAAAAWLARTPPQSNEDRVFKLLGLTWADAAHDVKQAVVRELMASQRSDGGWAQMPTMTSDAYATGAALVALHEAGVRPSDAAYRRGVQFLLDTQLADGSWLVRTRSHPTQIYFESGFPHGASQFISAAATNWAAQALIRSDRDRTGGTQSASSKRQPR